ncbi:OmpA family protein [Aquicoccus sp. SCR17]|nr:OmpA family protein [Carideicomes alvinocaridis]
MTRDMLKSTTAMVLSLGLAFPAPVFAQETDAQDPLKEAVESAEEQLENAGDAAESTVEETGEAVEEATDEATTDAEQAESEATPAESQVDATAEAAAEGEVSDQTAEDLPADTEAEADATAEAEAGAAATDTQTTEDVGVDAEAEANADATATEEGTAAAEADAEAETQSAEDVGVEEETTDSAAETAETTAEGTAAATEEATEETGDALGDAVSEAEQAMDGEDSVDSGEGADTATTEADAEAAAESDATGTEAEATAETTAAEEDGTATTEETDATASAEAEGETELPEASAEEQAEAAAEMAEGEAAAAAASDESSAEGEVTTETVTDENSRSSDEEFQTQVGQQPEGTEAEAQAQARASDDDDDDGGLTDAQKLAIGAFGAIAVGALLNNGSKVVSNSGDRVVVERDGQQYILKDDDALLRQPGNEIQTERFNDGSTRVTVTRPNGSKVQTVRAADGRVLRRTRITPDGERIVLFDDTQAEANRVEVNELPQVNEQRYTYESGDEESLRQALMATQNATGRSYSLNQIRRIDAVRKQMPVLAVDNVNFQTGSAVIRPEEAEELAALGRAMKQAIEENPREVFLVEGHTDAVGKASYNLALSDRRAESLALALSEYFDVPAENMIVQGYGESDLLVRTNDAERANRRAAIRRITPLLQGS